MKNKLGWLVVLGVLGILVAGTSLDPFTEPGTTLARPTIPARVAVEVAEVEVVKVAPAVPADLEALYRSACQDLLRNPDSRDPEKGCLLWKAACLHSKHIFNCLREEILESYTPTPAAEAAPTPEPTPTAMPTAESPVVYRTADSEGDSVLGLAPLVGGAIAIGLLLWQLVKKGKQVKKWLVGPYSG